MTAAALPLIIQPAELEARLADEHLLLVAVCQQPVFQKQHIPGSVLIDPAELVCGIKPAAGKLPTAEQLSALFSRIGLRDDRHVIAYDDEGGGWAGRLLWTLDVLGHSNYSYLDGGLVAWLKQGHGTQTGVDTPTPTQYQAELDGSVIADIDAVLQALGDDNTAIWDTRSPDEFSGLRVTAARNGHIPGAINLDWLELMDAANGLRLKPLEQLRERLQDLGITADKNIITHCHTHHRSGLSYLVGKALGLNIKAYDGSWAEWGNQPDTPVEN
jgi:thiosulfate/3-mercaptopyruvate sulfurtransferase